MERTERVEELKKMFDGVSAKLAEISNTIAVAMSEKVATINELKQGLARDNEELMDISTVTDNFANDLQEFVCETDQLTDRVDDILYNLEDVPSSIKIEDELDADFSDFDDDIEEVNSDEPAEIAE